MVAFILSCRTVSTAYIRHGGHGGRTVYHRLLSWHISTTRHTSATPCCRCAPTRTSCLPAAPALAAVAPSRCHYAVPGAARCRRAAWPLALARLPPAHLHLPCIYLPATRTGNTARCARAAPLPSSRFTAPDMDCLRTHTKHFTAATPLVAFLLHYERLTGLLGLATARW